MNNLTNVDTRKEKIMSVAEFTSETKNKILNKMVLWFDEHYSNEELLHILKEQLELSGRDIIDFCDNLQKGNGYIVVDKDTNIGIFNEWSGTCGYPDNYLEKDFVVPVDMIRNVQIEGASKSKYEYTINEVCGLVDEFWKDNALCYTETAPELVQENLNTVFEEINAEVEKLSEIEEIER